MSTWSGVEGREKEKKKRREEWCLERARVAILAEFLVFPFFSVFYLGSVSF